MKDLLIRGATIIDPSQNMTQIADMLIRKGQIAAIADQLPVGDATLVQADGLVCAPGLVDIHVHLRDPGQTYKEDIFSGCCAAAAGGVTSVVCMPNTDPVLDDPDLLQRLADKARRADAHVYPVGAVTQGMNGQALTDFTALKKAGVVALSDDGKPVPTAGLMAETLKKAAAVGLPVLSHSEDTELAGEGIMHEGSVSSLLGVPGIPAAAEEVAIAREIRLAAETGCPVHICHVSTAGSVALLRDARQKGIPVTGETAPHYFSLTHECLRSRDADFRMNPPLRTESDVRAIIRGLQDGTLTVIATDHAPHSPEDKADFEKAPNGALGLETSLAAGITYLVRPGFLTLLELLRCMSTAPARLLGLKAGSLHTGFPADLVLFDPQESWTVDPDRLHSKSRNTPFKGKALFGKVKATILSGKLVYMEEEPPCR